jgi:hypothetical protein
MVSPRMPDWERVHWLWQEYWANPPEGEEYTKFWEHYPRWNRARTTGMRLPHKGGEVLEVDYARISEKRPCKEALFVLNQLSSRVNIGT